MNLSQRTYIYINFYKYLRPCTYTIIACRFKAEDLYLYFYQAYSIRSYRKTYHNLIMPVSIKDLALDPKIHPFRLGKLRRQPKTKRIQKGAQNYQTRKCGNYRQIGHNTRCCIGLFVAKNRREERARDQNAIKDDNSISDIIVVDTGSLLQQCRN